MSTVSRWEPFRGLTSLQDQVSRLFDHSFAHNSESELTTWAPAVDIYETEGELVVKADLPDVDEKDIDVRVENNTLSIRGERKFRKNVNEENYLRVERAYGSFTRSFFFPTRSMRRLSARSTTTVCSPSTCRSAKSRSRNRSRSAFRPTASNA